MSIRWTLAACTRPRLPATRATAELPRLQRPQQLPLLEAAAPGPPNCTFYTYGLDNRCKKGDECEFLHSLAVARKIVPQESGKQQPRTAKLPAPTHGPIGNHSQRTLSDGDSSSNLTLAPALALAMASSNPDRGADGPQQNIFFHVSDWE